MLETFIQIDFPALLTVILCAASCSLLGTLLLLRRESMLSDSLSHAVLPGLAGTYLITGTLAPIYMVFGALVSCLACVGLIVAARRYARIESGAAMGIVFTSLFALGLYLLEHEVGSKVHLDAHHALYGALELIYWPSMRWEDLPADIPALLLVGLVVIGFVGVFFKEIRLFLFDPAFARLMGFRSYWFEWPFFVLVATLIVLAFNAVGSILVIAMFVCPPATARLFCDDLKSQLIWSVVIGVCGAIAGYVLASWAPLWLGFVHSLSAGGMIAVCSGLVLFGSLVFVRWRNV